MSGRVASKHHDTVTFPDDLNSTFSSEAVTADIAANFPGVSIIKDTVSSILHVFGPDIGSVDKAVHALRSFISEACIQKIYAEAFTDNDSENQRSNDATDVKKGTESISRSGSGSSTDSNNAGDLTCLEIKLKDVAVDLTKEEVRENFQWMNAERIEYQSGVAYVKFKTRRECVAAKDQMSDFYPNYDVTIITRGAWESALSSDRKREVKRPAFNVSDPDALDEYFRRHESDDGADTERLKKDARDRRKLLQRSGSDERKQPVTRPKSTDAPGPSRRNASPPHQPMPSRRPVSPPQQPMPKFNRQFAGGASNSYQNDYVPPPNFHGANKKVLSSSRTPYTQLPNHVQQLPPMLMPVGRRRPIAIDGNNICMHHGNHQVYSCLGLEIAVRYFLQRGHTEVHAFVPESKIRCPPNSQNPRIDRQDVLQRLEAENHLTVVPRKKTADGQKINPYDDMLIVKYAYETQGVIISNDNMIDVGFQNPKYKRFIDEWRITFCFAGNHFMVVDDPNGRRGLRAEDMLIAD